MILTEYERSRNLTINIPKDEKKSKVNQITWKRPVPKERSELAADTLYIGMSDFRYILKRLKASLLSFFDYGVFRSTQNFQFTQHFHI